MYSNLPLDELPMQLPMDNYIGYYTTVDDYANRRTQIASNEVFTIFEEQVTGIWLSTLKRQHQI